MPQTRTNPSNVGVAQLTRLLVAAEANRPIAGQPEMTRLVKPLGLA
jgi:hypothetical protein